MNFIKKQCINLITEKVIESAREGNIEEMVARMLIYGNNYALSEKSEEKLVSIVKDEYSYELMDSEEGQKSDVPEYPRLVRWIEKQETFNWIDIV
jgi:hypothetical protein